MAAATAATVRWLSLLRSRYRAWPLCTVCILRGAILYMLLYLCPGLSTILNIQNEKAFASSGVDQALKQRLPFCSVPLFASISYVRACSRGWFVGRSVARLWKYRKQTTGDEVNCFLCPNIHGALKRTTCGRFAHMTCLLMSPGVRIGDLKHKKRIDMSEVMAMIKTYPPAGVTTVVVFCCGGDGAVFSFFGCVEGAGIGV